MPTSTGKHKHSRRSRSRNTTPSTSTVASADTTALEPNPYTKLLALAAPQNVSLGEMLAHGGGSSPSSIPSAVALNHTLSELKATFVATLLSREEGYEQVLREIVKRRPEMARLQAERDAEERKQKAKSSSRKRDGQKERARDEERPLAVGAHGLARQDGQKDGSSSISSIASPEDASAPDGPTAASSPAESVDSHQPAAAPSIPHFQTFGPDPSKFHDPTTYHIRELADDMTEEERKQILCVAEHPHDDLHDLTPGTPPDRDFSNAKPANQISASVFANYVEPYIRPLTEEDIAFLKERGDRAGPFVMPRRGPRHYKEIWSEEDGAMALDSNTEKLPHNEPRGSIEQMTDEVAETDQNSTGPILARLLSALRPEGRTNGAEGHANDATTNGITGDSMDVDGEPQQNGDNNTNGHMTNGTGPQSPATHLPESGQPGWKTAAPVGGLRTDYATVDERLLGELRHIGFVGEADAPDYDGQYDDEVAARLRRLQGELRRQSLTNGARKARVLELAEERMAMQEYSTIADDLDGQINQAYLKRNRNLGKGKKGAKRPGGPGGGSHVVQVGGGSAAGGAGGAAGPGVGKPGVGEPIRALLERKREWNSMIGPVVNSGRASIPAETIFDPETVKRLEEKEQELWDQTDEYPDLAPSDLAIIQRVSRRLLSLGRDDNLWRWECFTHSRAELRWRRQELLSRQLTSTAALRDHVEAFRRRIAHSSPSSATAHENGDAHASSDNYEAQQVRQEIQGSFSRALASWDPKYPGENIDYYQEFIHRHAPISASWFQIPRDGSGNEKEDREVVGAGVLHPHGGVGDDANLVAPLDDGSVCIWALTSDRGRKKGAVIARSAPGILTAISNQTHGDALARNRALMTETGAVECVSIDSDQRKGFFAAFDTLAEVDLNTLQTVSRTPFPYPITAISEVSHATPLTVGTNLSLHLHDPRARPQRRSSTHFLGHCELVGGASPPKDGTSYLLNDHYIVGRKATLSQPGPLGILHRPSTDWGRSGSIWVCGRFTHLLNYSRRQFPRLHGTIASGARLSSMALLPWSSRQQTSDGGLAGDSHLGSREHTILAGGEYKGKGSLELYSLSPDLDCKASSSTATDHSHAGTHSSSLFTSAYQNRQTAARGKVLSVAPHGGRLVHAAGDGLVRWVERDGSTPVREWSIAEATGSRHSDDLEQETRHSDPRIGPPDEAPQDPPGDNDIIQKLVPMPSHPAGHRTGGEDLLFWTGDGSLGLLGFGPHPAFGPGDFEDVVLGWEELEHRREERWYGARMRRALERQANEVRFVRGLGLGP